jgi:Family of unknown function (DUF5996)
MALLGYDQFRDADDPRIALLAFLQSAYDAGARTGGWDRKELVSSLCPSGAELQALYQRSSLGADHALASACHHWRQIGGTAGPLAAARSRRLRRLVYTQRLVAASA